MNEEKTIVVLSRDARRRTEEISRFGYTLFSSKPLTARQVKSENPEAVISKDDEYYSELVFIRERNIEKYSEVKHLEARYFNIVDDKIPSLKISEMAVNICAFSIFGIPFLPFALFFRSKVRKKVQETTSVNMANDNTRRNLSLQAETVLKSC